jgi:acetylornithine deacetylase/succinyl-diaminopimelate desuccinylase family protein
MRSVSIQVKRKFMNQRYSLASKDPERIQRYQIIDDWIDQHFEEELAFLKALVKVPTDTPPGDNAPHAHQSAALLEAMGFHVELHPVDDTAVKAQGMKSITNLMLRRRYGDGLVIALNAHGDVVPPGEGWTYPPYGGEVHDGKLYGRAAAVNKSDFASYAFAIRALEACGAALHGTIELHLTYDEEFGGELGPGWLLSKGLTKPDYLIAAGFSYEVVTAHNGCLQLEVEVVGKMAHAAIPHTGIDALQAAVHILQALYRLNEDYKQICSKVPGIKHPYLNVGVIHGGTNTNVVPGKVSFKLDRRMIPEENPQAVEQAIRQTITEAASQCLGVELKVSRLLLAEAWKPQQGNEILVETIQDHAQSIFGTRPPARGTPLYTDVRLYGAQGIPAVIYGAGPRSVLESNAKRADEHIVLDDLLKATKVVARSLLDLMSQKKA